MSGIAFPIRISPTGSIVSDSGTERKKSLIASAILTSIGSRQDNPTIGVVGNTFVFRKLTESRKTIMRNIIGTTLQKDIDGVTIKGVDFVLKEDLDSPILQVYVRFIDLSTNENALVGVEITE